MEIKGLPESAEIPKGSQGEVEEGEVRDRVKHIGEERRGEMGLSDVRVGELIHQSLTEIFPWCGLPSDLPPCFNMHVHVTF